ncbi:MAG: ABC transporter substrate-binding protein [Desulfobacter sp.]|nr:MAG: ABC transporter substrate-binding protein [Desulfobacter sp.]
MRRYIMKKIAVIGILVFCMVTGGAWAQDTIKIGFNAPLTGFAASDGKSSSIGAKLAVKQINDAGGILGKQLELMVYDDQASASQSIPIANKLIGQDKVTVGISGSYSAPTRSAAGIFQEAKIPYISAYGIHPDITKAGDYVFRTSFLGEVQGRAGAKLIGETLGKKRVVIITLKNDFGKSLAAGFKEKAKDFGITIVNEYEYSIKDRQFGAIVAKVKSDKPDAIYASGYYFTAGPLVSQLRASGVNVPVIGQEGYDSQKFIEIAGKATEGVIITTSLDRDSDVPETSDFIKNFKAMAGYKADMVADITVKAATGTIKFNNLGEVMKNVQNQVVKNGQWHHHSVISDPELLAPPEK